MPRPSRAVLPLAALALPVLLGGCFERTQASVENTARPVQVVVVALADDAEARAYSGTIRPRREADLGFRAGGRIAERLVDVGAHVSAGQVLARLDPTDLALAVRGAEADLAAAEAQAVQAVADAGRSAKLRAQGWVAAAADEAKQAAARAATERVASARATLALARNRLTYGDLHAPTDGVVTAVLRDRGTVVGEGDPVFRLAESGAPEVEVQLPEQALPNAGRAGATVTLWARPVQRLPAHLRELSPAAEGRLRTYTARYVLDDAPEWVALGMSATLHLPDAAEDRVATLPAAALIDRGDGPGVWQVTPDGTLREHKVAVRRLEQDHVVVTGLADGAQVVAVGAQKLDPQARVRVADTRPAME
ncbi:MAG TPA: efflux RND transporter periplasmic adaptor subunit [Acetobacteraceae bacterium]|nr:efflux RND transporter periplasmic adaptor subunit [Acetobacteraceae bacterium]